MNFYRRFPGDYRSKTSHLSLEQHGAYTLLLDHQYATELPLPCLEQCLTVCSARTPEHVAAVSFVYETFFPNGINPRFQKEVSLADSRRQKAKEAAGTRWENAPSNASSNPPSNACGYAPDMPSQTPDSRLKEKPKPCVNPEGSHASPSPNEKLAAVLRVWDHYIVTFQKNPKILSFTVLRKRKGLARLDDGLEMAGGDLTKAERLMKLAVDALAASQFHMGQNDRGRRYDSWEDNLFRSTEQFQKWLDGGSRQ